MKIHTKCQIAISSFSALTLLDEFGTTLKPYSINQIAIM